MKKYLVLMLPLFLSACMKTSSTQLTQLQVHEFQTRTFDTTNANEVLTAIVEVFQGQGFMVKNVVPQVGLVSAIKEVNLEDSNPAFLRAVLGSINPAWGGKNSVVEATANVRTFNEQTKVRVTFQQKVMNNSGTLDTVSTIEDPQFYQFFFDEVGKSIFIEKQHMR